MDFSGKVVIVTGSGRATGIGFGIARVFGGLGATVILTSTTDRIFERQKEMEAQGYKAFGYVADLCDRSQVDSFIKDVVARFGRIDALVNNAGNASILDRENNRGTSHPTFMGITDEEFDMIVNRNLTLTYNVTKRVVPVMEKQNGGRIVFISSVTGPVVSHMGQPAYSASKAGIVGLSKSLAIEEGGHGILCNCILPGWIDTGALTPDRLAAGSDNPLKRPGTPEEVGWLAAFLCSSENSYVTGQDIVIDGGNCIQEMRTV